MNAQILCPHCDEWTKLKAAKISQVDMTKSTLKLGEAQVCDRCAQIIEAGEKVEYAGDIVVEHVTGTLQM